MHECRELVTAVAAVAVEVVAVTAAAASMSVSVLVRSAHEQLPLDLSGLMHEHRELPAPVSVAVSDEVGEVVAVEVVAVTVVAAVSVSVLVRSAHEQLRSRPDCRHA